VKPKSLDNLRKLAPYDRMALRIEPNPFWDEIQRSIPTEAQIRERLVKAIKKIPYPFPPGRKPYRSTYDFLVIRTLVDLITAPDLINSLCTSQAMYDMHQCELRLRKRNSRGYTMEFHESLLELMMKHIKDIQDLVSKTGVDEKWAREALDGSFAQLHKDLRVRFPFYPWTDDAEFSPMSFSGFILRVHAIFSEHFKAHTNTRVRRLSAHLTAIFCTPSDLLREGKLEPNPEAIRKLVARRTNDAKTGHSRKIQDPK
jgi:hypothetical protein